MTDLTGEKHSAEAASEDGRESITASWNRAVELQVHSEKRRGLAARARSMLDSPRATVAAWQRATHVRPHMASLPGSRSGRT